MALVADVVVAVVAVGGGGAGITPVAVVAENFAKRRLIL